MFDANVVISTASLPEKFTSNTKLPLAISYVPTIGESESLGRSFFILSTSACICVCLISVSSPYSNCTTTVDTPSCEFVITFLIPSTFSTASSTCLVIWLSTSSGEAPFHVTDATTTGISKFGNNSCFIFIIETSPKKNITIIITIVVTFLFRANSAAVIISPLNYLKIYYSDYCTTLIFSPFSIVVCPSIRYCTPVVSPSPSTTAL